MYTAVLFDTHCADSFYLLLWMETLHAYWCQQYWEEPYSFLTLEGTCQGHCHVYICYFFFLSFACFKLLFYCKSKKDDHLENMNLSKLFYRFVWNYIWGQAHICNECLLYILSFGAISWSGTNECPHIMIMQPYVLSQCVCNYCQ